MIEKLKYFVSQSKGCKGSVMKYSALDIAKYVINHEHKNSREISNLRLQKLLYFVQAKCLVDKGEPCFEDDLEAWDYGPVVPAVYYKYSKFHSKPIVEIELCTDIVNDIMDIINCVLDFFRNITTFELVQITHSQSPWIEARQKGSKSIISKDSIRNYFINV